MGSSRPPNNSISRTPSFLGDIACLRTGHAWEPCFGHFSIPPHFNTHARVHCKVWRYSDVPKSFFLQIHDLWAWIVYPPRCSYERGSPVDFSLGLCLVGLCDNSKPCLGTSCDLIQPGFTETGSSHPIKFQAIRFFGDSACLRSGLHLGTMFCTFQP